MLFLLKTLVTIDFLIVVALLVFRYALAPQHRDIVSTKIAALALLTPAVALFCGNVYIFYTYLAFITAFNSRSKSELASTYVFLLPLTPILSVETNAGGLYLFAISTITAMNFGALIGFLITSFPKSLSKQRYDICIILIITIFIYIYNRDSSVTGFLRGIAINILDFAAPYLLISRALVSRKDVEHFLLRLTLGGSVVALTASFQAGKHWVLYEVYYQAMHVVVPLGSWTMAMRGGLLRTGGSMLDYGAAGLFLSAILSLMPMLKAKFKPIGFWMMIALIISGLLAAQLRGAWIAALIGIIFILSYRGLWGRVTLLAGFSIAAEIAFLTFAKSGPLAGILGKTNEAGGTVTYRKQLLQQGFQQVQQHPLLGQPLDSLVRNLSDLVQGQHIVDFVNAHLFIAMTAGIPLFIIWCFVWILPVFVSWRRRRLPSADLLESPVAIIVPVMVAIATTSIIDRNLTWPTIALGLAGPCLALSRQRRGAQADRTMSPVAGLVARPRHLATNP